MRRRVLALLSLASAIAIAPRAGAQQVDPKSPYSMTSKEGLAAKLSLAIEALHAMKAIPAPIPAAVVQEAVDPTYLLQYLKTQGK